jgi:hypothetical protein
MGKVRTYLSTFDLNGDYKPFEDISKEVLRVGDVELSIDNTDFEIGLIKNSNLKLVVRNDSGLFSDPSNLNSIFELKRKDSKIRITWDRREMPLIAGFFMPGKEVLGEEVVLFEGLLNEVTSTQNILEQDVEFNILGYDSKLQEIEVPFGSLNGTMDYEEILLVSLNQSPFNDFVTVDAANINCAINQVPDDITDLENRTVFEALRELLKLSKSVLYINTNLDVVVSDRVPTASVVKEFFGQASIDGIENIIRLTGLRDGVNRVKNFFTWDETSLVASDATSISNFGVQKEEFRSRLIDVSSTSKIQAILDGYRDDFRDPKLELTITVPLGYDTIGLNILDRVSIDYPTVFIASDNELIPRYGIGVYGESRYPTGFFDLTIDATQPFKVLGKKISATNNTIAYKLREI